MALNTTPASTPKGFAEQYNAACQALSAEATAAHWADHLVRYLPTGEPQIRDGKDQQLKYLKEVFELAKENGVYGLVATDYVVTQLSGDFAIVRFRWEFKAKDGTLSGGANSAYILRRDADGWVAIANLELGEPQGP